MQDLLKIVKSLEDSGILLNGITETVKNEAIYEFFYVL